jgi:ABC-2 type transport system permease protein
MGAKRIQILFSQNARLLLGDPGPIFVFILTPLLVMAVIKPTQEIVLINRGFPDTNGSEQVVPGFTIMFAFFWMAFIGRSFFAEHGWGTWERLQATPASRAEIMLGKVLPAFLVILVQIVVLFVLSTILFDLESQGPLLVLLLPGVALICCVLALTVVLVAFCRTLTQIDALANMLTMVFACVGGSLAAISALPGWVETIAPAVPSYWATLATDRVILEGQGLSDVIVPTLVLLGFTVLLAVLAATRFSFGQSKAIEAA